MNRYLKLLLAGFILVLIGAGPMHAQFSGRSGVYGTGGGGSGSGFPVTTSQQISSGGTVTAQSGGTINCAAGSTCTGQTASQLDGSNKFSTTLYVDTAVSNAIAGVNPAIAVLAASTGSNIVGTYAQVGGGVGDTFTVTATGTFSLDGISINTIGQRVLLKDQTAANQNGIYTATVVGTTGVSAVFTRAMDYDTPGDVNNTGTVPVQSGTINTTTSWLLTSQVTSIGSSGSSLVYTQFSLNPSTIAKTDLSNLANPTAMPAGTPLCSTDTGGPCLTPSANLWTFNVNVTAPQFNGALNGNASTATNPATPPWSFANGGTGAQSQDGAFLNLSRYGNYVNWQAPPTTVAQLSASAPINAIGQVYDGSSSTDCVAGGGTNLVWCQKGSSGWANAGPGAGYASGSATTTTTNGSTSSGSSTIVLTSAASFVPYQWIYIATGGLGISGSYAYSSGGTFSGSGYCVATPLNGGGFSGSGTLTITGGTGGGNLGSLSAGTGFTSAPTSWALSSSVSYSCSGTATTTGGSTTAVPYLGMITAVNGNTISVTPATQATISNGATVKHDETESLQYLWNAFTNTGVHVFAPDGTYNVNGPLQYAYAPNGILLLPNVLYGTYGVLPFTLEGMTQPPANMTVGGFVQAMPGTSAAIIQTAGTSGNLISGYFPQSTGQTSTGVMPVFRNLIFRAYANPSITMIKATYFSDFRGENLQFDNGQTGNATQPTSSNGIAIALPNTNNQADCSVLNSTFYGFYYGIKWTEHCYLNQLKFAQDYIALAPFNSPNHALAAGRVLIQNSTYGLYELSAATLDIQELDFENDSSPTWAQTTANCYDTGNQLYGHVGWTLVIGGSGISSALVTNGCNNLQLHPLGPSGHGYVPVAAFSTTQSGNLIAAPRGNQKYNIKYYLWQAASGSGGTCTTNATATVDFTWTDPASQAQTQTYTAMNVTPTLAGGAFQSNVLPIVTKSGTAIAYTITWANGNCNTQPTAQAQIWADADN